MPSELMFWAAEFMFSAFDSSFCFERTVFHLAVETSKPRSHNSLADASLLFRFLSTWKRKKMIASFMGHCSEILFPFFFFYFPGAVLVYARAFVLWKDPRYLLACRQCADVIWKRGLLKKGPGGSTIDCVSWIPMLFAQVIEQIPMFPIAIHVT